MNHNGKVNDEVFDKAKTLLSCGIPQNQTAKLLGISITTVKKIIKADSVEEYKRKNREDKKEQHNKNAEAKQTVDTKELYFQQQILGMIRQQNQMIFDMSKTIELVSNKITAIVEQLT